MSKSAKILFSNCLNLSNKGLLLNFFLILNVSRFKDFFDLIEFVIIPFDKKTFQERTIYADIKLSFRCVIHKLLFFKKYSWNNKKEKKTYFFLQHFQYK